MRYLIVLIALAAVVGCAEEVGPPPPPSAESCLAEMASVYKYIEYSKLPPPRKTDDFENYIDTMPNALARIKEGDLVVAWGVGRASAPPAGSQILAYEKKAATEGGAVMLRDGTIKQVTADEFRAAGVAK